MLKSNDVYGPDLYDGAVVAHTYRNNITVFFPKSYGGIADRSWTLRYAETKAMRLEANDPSYGPAYRHNPDRPTWLGDYERRLMKIAVDEIRKQVETRMGKASLVTSLELSGSDYKVRKLPEPCWVLAKDRWGSYYTYKADACVKWKGVAVLGVPSGTPVNSGHLCPGGFVTEAAVVRAMLTHKCRVSVPSFYSNEF